MSETSRVGNPTGPRLGAFEYANAITPSGMSGWGSILPGDDLLSPAKDYHRPRTLNGRVRDGNGCGRPGVVTGSLRAVSLETSGGSGVSLPDEDYRVFVGPHTRALSRGHATDWWSGPRRGSMRRSDRLLVPVS